MLVRGRAGRKSASHMGHNHHIVPQEQSNALPVRTLLRPEIYYPTQPQILRGPFLSFNMQTALLQSVCKVLLLTLEQDFLRFSLRMHRQSQVRLSPPRSRWWVVGKNTVGVNDIC